MRSARRDAHICHSIIKREKMDAYVTFIKCGCCGVDGTIRHKTDFHRLPTWEESVSKMRSENFRKRQAAQREQERKSR